MLVLVTTLTAALLSLAGLAVWEAHETSRQRAAEQMLGTARAMALLVDQEFARAEALLQGVAADPDVAAGDAQAFLNSATRLGRALDGLVMAMAEAPGFQLANTLRGTLPPGHPMAPGLDAVFGTGRTTISNLYSGTVTGRPAVSIAVPIPREEGPPRYAIGITLNRARLTEALTRQHLPPGAVAAVLDGRHVVVARTRREEEVVGLPATPAVARGLAERGEGVVEKLVNQDGEVSVVAYARAPTSGYAVALAVPEALFAQARNASLTQLATQALPVAAGGLLLAFLLGLRLRGALAALPGGGAGPRIAEVEELARALSAANAARAGSEAALRDRTAWLEATQRAAQVGTWDHDLRTREVRWSETMWTLYGLDPAGAGPLTPRFFRSLVLEEDLPAVDAGMAEALRSGTYALEFRIRRGDGAVRWMRAQGVLERAEDGTPLRLLGANLDITERRELAAEREALLAQKDLLVQEMHHRVKNSLQLVQGLLLLQARGAEPGLAARLREAAGRIVSIASVHRRLYEGGPGPQQDAADHLAGLVEDLSRSVGHAAREIRLEAAPGLRLSPERMAALGLLATELVTNALKHGAGCITLRLAHDAEQAELVVQDEGPGFPPGFDPARSQGLGMRVALAMARQLRGTLRVAEGPGGRVTAMLPILPPSSPTPADPAASR
ncbi:sensor histidine kinase [Falsiroseomonas sp. CW058]|uniref:sensor histidine kinase n=1 Tax=Falsiroseomonas sp. CW058 TaxID=3388664 RepID=UPI003D31F3CA